MKAYLVVLSSKVDRKAIVDYLADLDGFGTWFYSMPNSFFIVSSHSADDISGYISKRFGKKRHFVTEISASNRQGWMPKDHWKSL